MENLDVYSIGELVIDFTPGKEPFSYVGNPGGAPGNMAIAMSKNGLKAGMCSSVGDDDFGRYLYDVLKENGVKIINKKLCDQAVTTLAFVTLYANGDRSFTFARKPGADMFLSPDDVKEEDIENSVIIHAGSVSMTASPSADAIVRAMKLGREKNRLVSFDVNYRSHLWNGNMAACTAKVEEILPYVDLLKVSEEETEMFGGEDKMPGLMEKYGITSIVETLGDGGSQCFFNGKIIPVAPLKSECVDATGAGDAFWGGFLSWLRISGVKNAADITEPVLKKALEYASASGGLCVRKYGGIPALPTQAEILEILQWELP